MAAPLHPGMEPDLRPRARPSSKASHPRLARAQGIQRDAGFKILLTVLGREGISLCRVIAYPFAVGESSVPDLPDQVSDQACAPFASLGLFVVCCHMTIGNHSEFPTGDPKKSCRSADFKGSSLTEHLCQQILVCQRAPRAQPMAARGARTRNRATQSNSSEWRQYERFWIYVPQHRKQSTEQ